MDDRSLAQPNANVPDAGTAPPQTALPTPVAPTPTAPQSGANSNAPDTDTAAGASIPQSAVNNPAVPSQKMATMADLNKTSPAPQHAALYNAAIEMTGGQRYTTNVDADGNTVRTPIEPKPWALGLALALNVLSGGLQGLAPTGPGRYGKAAEIGVKAGMEQRAAVQQANAAQDEKAAADQNIKMNTVRTNLQIRQMAQNVGKQDMEMNKAYVDGMAPQAKMVEAHPQFIKADIPEDKVQENLAKYPVTSFLYIPHGEPFPIMDTATGKQKEVNGVPTWGHNYYIVDAKAKGVLTQEIQDQGYKIGKFRNPDGSRVNVPVTSEYPMSTIAQYGAQFARIQTSEEMLDKHADAFLADKAAPREPLADWASKDPRNMQAVDDYSRFMGAGAPDQVFGAMLANGAGQSAQLLMQHMGVTTEDVRKAENQRLADAAEAKNVKANPAELDAQKRQDLLLKDPITAANADSVIAAHNKPTTGVVIPEDRYQQAVAFNDQQTLQAGKKSAAEAKGKTDAEAKSGDIQELAQNIVVGGDLAKISDVTSMRGGQRTAMANALHDAAVAAGKNPNDYSAQALATKAEMYKDYREGKTSNNIQAFDAFLGHANDAMDANDAWRRSSSPLINKPLNWFAKNLSDDPNYVAFTTALEPVRKEFMSFLNANRAEHESDIKTMETVLSNDKSPAQIETALKQLGKSADIRLRSIGTKYRNTMGQDFPNLVSDEGKQTLQRMGITGQPNVAQQSRVVPAGAIPGRDASGNIVGYKTADGKVVRF
jgi:hypothetical protein